MFTIEQVIADHYPILNQRKLSGPIIKLLLRYLVHEQAFLDFAKAYPHLHGIEFIEQVLEYFHFSYAVNDRQRENIPVSGKVIIIGNHPIGSLDGLALLKLVHEVRSDVKIIANNLLTSIPPLRTCLLPVRNMTGTSKRQHIQRIHNALAKEEAVIMFPAGEVSRFGFRGVRDGQWNKGFLKMAERAKAPILPIYISGHNSIPFYLASTVIKPLSTVMLVGEMFRQRKKQLKMTIGQIIPYQAYSALSIDRKEKTKLFKKHVYRLGQGKKSLFATESAIAGPERKTDLKKAVQMGEKLGKTPDGKTIYLFEPVDSSTVMREIGRLRELAFRAVGEGTSKRRDLDRFDWHYQHLILWDEEELEIAGAYRFVDAGKTILQNKPNCLYSGSLFKLDEQKCYFIKDGLELGRSFVQPRYWGKRSLDYLWYGIGAFLVKNRQYRYLFGPVSISNAMPLMARELLIYFYKLYFTGKSGIGRSRNPFNFSHPIETLKKEFSGENYRADFIKLKSLLNNLGTAIPPLYKQYTELCEPGGVVFLDFNIDPAFNNCVDGLVIVDIDKLKTQKRKRYMEETLLVSLINCDYPGRTMPNIKKIFILDTNVILHDSSCIHCFAEHDIIIPIPVLEELDQFKKGSQIINDNARQFVRELDKLSSDKLFNGGIALGNGKGKIALRLDVDVHPDLRKTFSKTEKKDHRIINIAYHTSQTQKEHTVILVSKDVNLRMKARSVKLKAEDYTTDYVRDPALLFSGCRYEENVEASLIEKLFGQKGEITAQDYTPTTTMHPNEYLVLRNGKKSALATYIPSEIEGDFAIKRVIKETVYGITPRNAEQSFAVHALLNSSVKLVTISGKAGTGKTLLALAAALENRTHYRQILLTRPIVPLSNKDIGFLPGDIQSKIKPYMQPLFDNLSVIRGQFSEKSDMFQRLQTMLEDGKLAIEPLAYIRGRSLVKMFMIVDEAQNLTPHEVKTIITRAGEGTKIVFTGDIYQIDHPYLGIRSNGLSTLIDKMQGQKLYAHIDLQKGERSELAELASNIL